MTELRASDSSSISAEHLFTVRSPDDLAAGTVRPFTSEAASTAMPKKMALFRIKGPIKSAKKGIQLVVMLKRAHAPETYRWRTLLTSLERDQLGGRVNDTQANVFGRVLDVLTTKIPGLRRPAVRVVDGELCLAWSYRDRPGLMFTIEIMPDGLMNYFLRDEVLGTTIANEEPTLELPEELVTGALAYVR